MNLSWATDFWLLTPSKLTQKEMVKIANFKRMKLKCPTSNVQSQKCCIHKVMTKKTTFDIRLSTLRHMKSIQHFWELQFFGVCTKLGEKIGVSPASIRMFFIYMSFLTYGSPILIYLVFAFTIKIRSHLRRRSVVWEL